MAFFSLGTISPVDKASSSAYSCRECAKEFVSASDLQLHMQYMHDAHVRGQEARLEKRGCCSVGERCNRVMLNICDFNFMLCLFLGQGHRPHWSVV